MKISHEKKEEKTDKFMQIVAFTFEDQRTSKLNF